MSVVSSPDPSSRSARHVDHLDNHGKQQQQQRDLSWHLLVNISAPRQGSKREPVNFERDPKLKTIRPLPELHHYATIISFRERSQSTNCSTGSN